VCRRAYGVKRKNYFDDNDNDVDDDNNNNNNKKKKKKKKKTKKKEKKLGFAEVRTDRPRGLVTHTEQRDEIFR